MNVAVPTIIFPTCCMAKEECVCRSCMCLYRHETTAHCLLNSIPSGAGAVYVVPIQPFEVITKL